MTDSGWARTRALKDANIATRGRKPRTASIQTREDLQEKMIRSQTKTFKKWANSRLALRNIKLVDLTEDLKDGVALVNLAEILTGQDVDGRYTKKPRNHAQVVENLSLAFQLLEKTGKCKLHCSLESILDDEHNTKLDLGLMWTLIRHFQLENGGEIKVRSHKADILKWLNEVVGGKPGVKETNNLGGFIKNGAALCHLVNLLAPGTIAEEDINPKDPERTLRVAFDAAREHLGIPDLLDVEDVLHDPDDLSLMTYISYFRSMYRENETEIVNNQKLLNTRTVESQTDKSGPNAMKDPKQEQELKEATAKLKDLEKEHTSLVASHDIAKTAVETKDALLAAKVSEVEAKEMALSAKKSEHDAVLKNLKEEKKAHEKTAAALKTKEGDHEEETKAHTKERESHQVTAEKLKAKTREHEDTVDELRKKSRENDDLSDQLSKKNREYEDEVSAHERERKKHASTTEDLERKKKQLNEETEALAKKTKDYEATVAALETKRRELEKKERELEDETKTHRLERENHSQTKVDLEGKQKALAMEEERHEGTAKELKSTAEALRETEEALKKKREEHEDSVDALKKKNAEHDAVVDALKKKTKEHEDTTEALAKKTKEHQRSEDTLEKETKEHKNTAAELEATKEKLKKRIEEHEMTEKALKEKQKEYDDTLKNLNNTSDELKRALEQLESKTDEQSGTSDELKKTQKELEETQNDRNDTAKRLESTSAELKRTLETLEAKTEEQEDTSGELKKTQKELEDTQNDRDDTAKKLNSTSEELQRTLETLKAKTEEQDDTSGELKKIQQELEECQFALKSKTQEEEDTADKLKRKAQDYDDEVAALTKERSKHADTAKELEERMRDLKERTASLEERDAELAKTKSGLKDEEDEVSRLKKELADLQEEHAQEKDAHKQERDAHAKERDAHAKEQEEHARTKEELEAKHNEHEAELAKRLAEEEAHAKERDSHGATAEELAINSKKLEETIAALQEKSRLHDEELDAHKRERESHGATAEELKARTSALEAKTKEHEDAEQRKKALDEQFKAHQDATAEEMKRLKKRIEEHEKDVAERTADQERLNKELEEEAKQRQLAETEAQMQREEMQKQGLEMETKGAQAAERQAALTAERERLEAERNDLLNHKENLTAERDQLASDHKDVTQHRDELAAHKEQLTVERDSLLEHRDNLLAEKSQLEKDHASKTDEVGSLMKELTSAMDELKATKADLKVQKERLSAAKEQLATFQEEHAQNKMLLEEALAAQKLDLDMVEELKRKVQAAHELADDARSDAESLKRLLEGKNDELASSSHDQLALKKDLEKANESIAVLSSDAKETKKERDDLRKELADLARTLKAKDDECKETAEERDDMKEIGRDLKKEYDKMKAQIDTNGEGVQGEQAKQLHVMAAEAKAKDAEIAHLKQQVERGERRASARKPTSAGAGESTLHTPPPEDCHECTRLRALLAAAEAQLAATGDEQPTCHKCPELNRVVGEQAADLASKDKDRRQQQEEAQQQHADHERTKEALERQTGEAARLQEEVQLLKAALSEEAHGDDASSSECHKCAKLQALLAQKDEALATAQQRAADDRQTLEGRLVAEEKKAAARTKDLERQLDQAVKERDAYQPLLDSLTKKEEGLVADNKFMTDKLARAEKATAALEEEISALKDSAMDEASPTCHKCQKLQALVAQGDAKLEREREQGAAEVRRLQEQLERKQAVTTAVSSQPQERSAPPPPHDCTKCKRLEDALDRKSALCKSGEKTIADLEAENVALRSGHEPSHSEECHKCKRLEDALETEKANNTSLEATVANLERENEELMRTVEAKRAAPDKEKEAAFGHGPETCHECARYKKALENKDKDYQASELEVADLEHQVEMLKEHQNDGSTKTAHHAPVTHECSKCKRLKSSLDRKEENNKDAEATINRLEHEIAALKANNAATSPKSVAQLPRVVSAANVSQECHKCKRLKDVVTRKDGDLNALELHVVELEKENEQLKGTVAAHRSTAGPAPSASRAGTAELTHAGARERAPPAGAAPHECSKCKRLRDALDRKTADLRSAKESVEQLEQELRSAGKDVPTAKAAPPAASSNCHRCKQLQEAMRRKDAEHQNDQRYLRDKCKRSQSAVEGLEKEVEALQSARRTPRSPRNNEATKEDCHKCPRLEASNASLKGRLEQEKEQAHEDRVQLQRKLDKAVEAYHRAAGEARGHKQQLGEKNSTDTNRKESSKHLEEAEKRAIAAEEEATAAREEARAAETKLAALEMQLEDAQESAQESDARAQHMSDKVHYSLEHDSMEKEKLQEQLARAKAKLNSLRTELEVARAEQTSSIVGDGDVEKERMLKRIAQLEKDNDALLEKLQDTEDALDQAEIARAHHEQRVGVAMEKAERLQREATVTRQQSAKDLNSAADSGSLSPALARKLLMSSQRSTTKIDQLASGKKDAEEQSDRLRIELSAEQSRTASAKKALDSKQRRLAKLEDEVSALRAVVAQTPKAGKAPRKCCRAVATQTDAHVVEAPLFDEIGTLPPQRAAQGARAVHTLPPALAAAVVKVVDASREGEWTPELQEAAREASRAVEDVSAQEGSGDPTDLHVLAVALEAMSHPKGPESIVGFERQDLRQQVRGLQTAMKKLFREIEEAKRRDPTLNIHIPDGFASSPPETAGATNDSGQDVNPVKRAQLQRARDLLAEREGSVAGTAHTFHNDGDVSPAAVRELVAASRSLQRKHEETEAELSVVRAGVQQYANMLAQAESDRDAARASSKKNAAKARKLATAFTALRDRQRNTKDTPTAPPVTFNASTQTRTRMPQRDQSLAPQDNGEVSTLDDSSPGDLSRRAIARADGPRADGRRMSSSPAPPPADAVSFDAWKSRSSSPSKKRTSKPTGPKVLADGEVPGRVRPVWRPTGDNQYSHMEHPGFAVEDPEQPLRQ